MASNLPASSSQQPFANPQPAPVSTSSQAASHATSPPTKQSLKSWWKGFRPPTKNPEPNGKSPSILCSIMQDSSPLQRFYFASHYSTKIKHNQEADFKESSMGPEAPNTDGPLSETFGAKRSTESPSFKEASQASSIKGSSHETFFEALRGKVCRSKRARAVHHSRHTTRSRSVLRSIGKWCRLRQPDCFGTSRPDYKKGESISSASGTFPASRYNETSATPIVTRTIRGAKPRPYFHLFKRVYVKLSTTSSLKHNAKTFTQVVEQPTGIFGVPLRQSITYANVAISLVDAEGKSYIYGYVPIVVAKCGVYLKEKATNVEGIFRLSGSEKRIKELKTIFDSPDRYGKGLDWAGYTVHDAANVLRRYLNLLPEPIVPLDLYDRFREPLRGHTKQAVGDNEGPQLEDDFDVGNAITTYQKLITELPPLNRQLLLYILDLLAVFASKSDENRMNSQNLAAIFQPGMLSHPQHDMAPSEYRLSQDVLIFLIENQDHFLIGMRGTAADEKTVQEVQSGGTPPLGTPSTPGRTKNNLGRSASNASAGADSVRKFGGVRRNVSVSSRHSRQSNGAPSPATPTYGSTLSHASSGGVHRSNTVPSKKSPGIPQGRLQKNSGSPSPTTAVASTSSSHPTAPRGLSPSAPVATANRNISPSSPGFAPSTIGASSLAPSSQAASTVTSQERLLGDLEKQPDTTTPSRERNVSSLFQRSPTVESEKKQPNKLRKKRITSSSNPSAQSSTHSLHASDSASPAIRPIRDAQDITEHPQLETIPSANPTFSNTDATPPATEAPRAEFTLPLRPAEHHQNSDKTLRPKDSPVSSVHSRSSFNDHSDLDHVDDHGLGNETKERKSRWRLSRRREDSQQHSALSPPKALGSDATAGASSSSVGSSSRPSKSFTGETNPVSSDSTLVGPTTQPGSDNAPVSGTGSGGDERKGPLGWIKSKMREKREERDADRTKSPPASTDRLRGASQPRSTSIEIKRNEYPDRIDEPPSSQPTQHTQQ